MSRQPSERVALSWRFRLLLPAVLLGVAVVLAGTSLPVGAAADEAVNVDEEKKDEPKKDQPKKEQPKKEEAKKEAPKTDQDRLREAREAMEKARREHREAIEKADRKFREQMEAANAKMREAMEKSRAEEARRFGRGIRSQGRLGVMVDRPSNVMVDQLNLGKGKGLVVHEVTPGSPAEKVGIKPHDVLLKVGDKDVPNDVGEFVRQLNEIKPNTPVDVVVLRKGKQETLKGLSLPEARPTARPLLNRPIFGGVGGPVGIFNPCR